MVIENLIKTDKAGDINSSIILVNGKVKPQFKATINSISSALDCFGISDIRNANFKPVDYQKGNQKPQNRINNYR